MVSLVLDCNCSFNNPSDELTVPIHLDNSQQPQQQQQSRYYNTATVTVPMAQSALSPMRWLCGLLLLVSAANALKFDLVAHTGGESLKKERCIRNFVSSDTLVVVTSTVDGYKGDGMLVNIHVCYGGGENEEQRWGGKKS